jgi:ATP-dependent Clp protease protease subunit
MKFGRLITFSVGIFLLLNSVQICSASMFSGNKNRNDNMYNDVLQMTNDNTVVIRGEISEDSASDFISDIHKIANNEDAEAVNDIYVFLMTPGGSVIDGYNIIQTLDAWTLAGKNITCIADTAYSMGFSILQACTNRYVLKGSSVMQHQMSFGLEGQLENNKNRFKFIESIGREMDNQQSERLGLSYEDFKKKTLSDWWLFGNSIVEENVADKMVNVLCDHKLSNETYFKEFDFVFFGKIKFEFSKCPLIKAPKSIDFGNNNANDVDYMNDSFIKGYINPSVI